MQRALRNGAFLFVLTLTLLCVCGALALETVDLDENGVRYFLKTGETCLTRADMPKETPDLMSMDAQTVLEAMERDGSILMVVNEEGRHAALRILDASEALAASDVSGLDAEARERLLLALGRMHNADTAAWLTDMADYALCESRTGEPLTMYTLSLNTLYLGHIYSFRMEVVGREPDDEDKAFLKDVASRTLRLGVASGEAETLSLPSLPTLGDEVAEATVEDGGVLLTLDPLPAVSPSNAVTLSGKTDANAKLRYQVNGSSSSAFSPDEDGAFSVLARNLKNGKENKIAITASLDGKRTTYSFTVSLDWQDTPLVLSQINGNSFADAVIISGVTLPGTEVEVTKGGKESSVAVDESGRFSFELPTRKAGNFAFSVRATYGGYRRTEINGKIRRNSEESAQKAAAKLNYQKLAESPKRYEGTSVLYSCTVQALDYENGQPKCLLDIGLGQTLVLLLDSLTGIHQGDTLRVLGTLTGTMEKVADQEAPAMSLDALLP